MTVDHDPSRSSSKSQASKLRTAAQLVALMLVGALLALLIWKTVRVSAGGEFVASIKQGEMPTAPAFDLPVISKPPAEWPSRLRPALADGRIALAELAGTPVVLNFWASWCLPCKDEAPFFAASARAHPNIAFLGLDVQDFVPDARRFLSELEVPYPSVRDGSERTYSAYGLTGVPETYYIDSSGRVVGHSPGAVSRRELERGIAALLRAPP